MAGAAAGGASYHLEEDALQKILLHAAKYPAAHVAGVLLGNLGGSSGAAIVDVVPLFHASLFLAPAVEAALVQVEAYAQQQGLAVVGLYYGDYKFAASDVHLAARRIADRLQDKVPASVMLVLQGKRLAAFTSSGASSPLELWLRDANKGWRPVSSSSAAPSLALTRGGWPQSQVRFLKLHSGLVHRQVADFDEHLDDVRRDWRNLGLFDGGNAAAGGVVSAGAVVKAVKSAKKQ